MTDHPVSAEGPDEYETLGYVNGPFPVADLLLWLGLARSKSDARRVIEQGGAYLNDERVQPGRVLLPGDLLHGRYVLLRRGKRNVSVLEVLSPGDDPAGIHAPLALVPAWEAA
jgi:tyrosyl-tRNA synthetase